METKEDWFTKPSCISCRYVKYLQDPSTNICVTCRIYNGGDCRMPNHWETVPGSELDKLQKRLKGEMEWII